MSPLFHPFYTQPTSVWLRKWELTTYKQVSETLIETMTLSSSDMGNNALRMRFEINQVATGHWYAYADIEIYNTDGLTTQKVILNDYQVVVNAGYQNGPYGEIFKGPTWLAYWERENIVDFKTTIQCLVGALATDNIVGKSMGSGARFEQMVNHIAQYAIHDFTVGSVSDEIKENPAQLSRSATYFGSPAKFFDQIAADNNAQWYMDQDGQPHFGNIARNPTTRTELVYTPQDIIDTPQQTAQNGVLVKVNLDTRAKVQINPPMMFRIDNSAIRFEKREVGVVPTILDKDNEYVIIGVKHVGDTRGPDWYTEINGVIPGDAEIAAIIGAQGT